MGEGNGRDVIPVNVVGLPNVVSTSLMVPLAHLNKGLLTKTANEG